MKTKLKINSVRLEHAFDESPDTSWMGEYASKPANRFSLDREIVNGYLERGQYRYFNPSFNYVTTDGKPCDGLTDTDVAAYTLQDYNRMEALNAGQWQFVGIIAKAELWNPASHVTQVIRSGGLWGIESDSDKAYLTEVEQEQLAALRTELLAMGIGPRAIAHAFKSATTE